MWGVCEIGLGLVLGLAAFCSTVLVWPLTDDCGISSGGFMLFLNQAKKIPNTILLTFLKFEILPAFAHFLYQYNRYTCSTCAISIVKA